MSLDINNITISAEKKTWSPGQYFKFPTNKGWKLPLACASIPSEKVLKFIHTRNDLLENGICEGPFGTCFPMEMVTPDRPIYLIGGGTAYSSLRSVHKSLTGKNVHLIYSAKKITNLPFPEELRKLAKNDSNKISLSREDNSNFLKGRVTAHIPNSFENNSLVYICGSVGLTESVLQEVKNRGVTKDRIIVSLPMEEKDGGPILCLAGNEQKISSFIDKWKSWGN
jgi:NAD(P)H-flavin reductase